MKSGRVRFRLSMRNVTQRLTDYNHIIFDIRRTCYCELGYGLACALKLWALTHIQFSTERIHTARVHGQDWGSNASSPRKTLRVLKASKDMGRALYPLS